MSPRKKQMYLLAIGLGGAALLIDRVFLSSGPALADAGVSLSADPASESTPVVPLAAPSPSGSTSAQGTAPAVATLLIPEIPFPKGVTSAVSSENTRDLFRPAFRAGLPATGSAGTGTPDAPDAAGKSGFVDRHRLQAVFSQGGAAIAVVDGTWLQTGDRVDGCVLREVRETLAVFECRDGEAHLVIGGDKSVRNP